MRINSPRPAFKILSFFPSSFFTADLMPAIFQESNRFIYNFILNRTYGQGFENLEICTENDFQNVIVYVFVDQKAYLRRD